MVLTSNSTSARCNRLNKGALCRCTAAPGVSFLTTRNHDNVLHAIPPKLPVNSRITGNAVLSCSRQHCCRNHTILRTTDVNCRLRSTRVTVHYGLVAISKHGVIDRSTKRVSARRSTRLVSCLGRRLTASSVYVCINGRCHRLLICGRKDARVGTVPPRSVVNGS